VSRHQKTHSPTHTCPDHQPSFISFLCLLRSIASSLFNLRAWQCITFHRKQCHITAGKSISWIAIMKWVVNIVMSRSEQWWSTCWSGCCCHHEVVVWWGISRRHLYSWSVASLLPCLSQSTDLVSMNVRDSQSASQSRTDCHPQWAPQDDGHLSSVCSYKQWRAEYARNPSLLCSAVTLFQFLERQHFESVAWNTIYLRIW